MTLTNNALTRAARTKAASARDKAKLAEAELVAANDDLAEAIDHRDPAAKVKRAHVRTQVAEKAVAEAAHDMEAVEVLLDVAEGSTAPPDPPAAASGV